MHAKGYFLVIYYFLPDPQIYGGIKVGYQFTELLNGFGISAVVASPGGKAPQWFQCSAPVASEETVLRNLTASDIVIFSLPYDYERLRQTPAHLVFHCQGTNPLHAPTFKDPHATILTCWNQATEYVKRHYAREPIDVGISISDCFFYAGELKYADVVAFMPRRGIELAETCMEACPGLNFFAIDKMHEKDTAMIMKGAEFFVATAENEWFGLPALEAMAAGCVVVSVPVLGGMDYLRDGENCVITEKEEMPERLRWIARPDNGMFRAKLRHHAIATAMHYRLSLQKRRLEGLLHSQLKIFMS